MVQFSEAMCLTNQSRGDGNCDLYSHLLGEIDPPRSSQRHDHQGHRARAPPRPRLFLRRGSRTPGIVRRSEHYRPKSVERITSNNNKIGHANIYFVRIPEIRSRLRKNPDPLLPLKSGRKMGFLNRPFKACSLAVRRKGEIGEIEHSVNPQIIGPKGPFLFGRVGK